MSVKKPDSIDCNKSNRFVVSCTEEGFGSTAQKANTAARKNARTKRDDEYDALKQSTHCPAKCPEEDDAWSRKLSEGNQGTAFVWETKPKKIYIGYGWARANAILQCPPVPKKKKKATHKGAGKTIEKTTKKGIERIQRKR